MRIYTSRNRVTGNISVIIMVVFICLVSIVSVLASNWNYNYNIPANYEYGPLLSLADDSKMSFMTRPTGTYGVYLYVYRENEPKAVRVVNNAFFPYHTSRSPVVLNTWSYQGYWYFSYLKAGLVKTTGTLYIKTYR